MKAPFPIQPQLTQIALAYRNTSYIADSVLPRFPVSVQSFKYTQYNKSERFTIPDTDVGRTSQPNEVEFGGTETEASTTDRALDDPIPYADIENAKGANFDIEGTAVEGIMDLIDLQREQRVATLVFNAANYAAANKVTLAGTDQWSDFANSDPIADIMLGLDSCIMRPNKACMSRGVFTKLSTHPDIVKAVNGNSGDSGIARRRAIAELFELDDILVGEAWYNSAAKGQTAAYGRLWGNAFLLFRDEKQALQRKGATFGGTAQWGGRIAGSWEDKNIGMRGGKRVRSGESTKEVLIAADLAYLITTPIA